ncbi:MAG TPA: hypothetical protein VFK44_02430 [Bacillales bacterium]|nr:hypothetical protein [Bacillales bacterium]
MQNDLFDEKMEHLKRSYRNLPPISTRSSTMDRIEMIRRRRNKPLAVYAAACSLIVIAGVWAASGSMLHDGGATRQNQSASDSSAMIESVPKADSGNTESAKTFFASDKKDMLTSSDQHSSQQPLAVPASIIVQKAIRAIETDVAKRYPTKLPVPEGKYLSAATESKPDHYEVRLYVVNNPIDVNSPLLEELGAEQELASFGANFYGNESEAANEVKSVMENLPVDIFENETKRMDLGDHISAVVGKGQKISGLRWQEGRWFVTTVGKNDEFDAVTKLSKMVVSFLRTNTLPAPHDVGTIFISMSSTGHKVMIFRQEHNAVYHVVSDNNPMTALQLAVSMQDAS